MKKYFANFRVNNGTSLINPIEDTNLNKIRKGIKSIASGEIFYSAKGRITISDEDGRVVEVYEARWYFESKSSSYNIKWCKCKF